MVKISRGKYILAAATLAIFGAATGSIGYIGSAGATTSNLTMAATIQPSMTLTLSTDSSVLDILPTSTGTFGSTSVTVGAYSNGSIGYTLTMTASSTTLNGRDTNTIPTLTSAVSCTGNETCTSSNFTPGHWGIAVDSGAYGPASTSTTELLNVTSATTGVLDGSDSNSPSRKTIHLGANLDLTTPVDEYTTVINFALVSGSVAQYDVTFNYDSHFTSFALEDASGNTVTPNPDGVGDNTKTYTLDYAGTYTIVGGYVTRYEFGAMNVSFGSGFVNGDTYTVGGASTVAVTSQKGPLVCNPAGTTIGTNTNDDIVCMQDISSTNRSAILGSMTAEADYTLYDSRDDSEYTVAKLADGNVWMNQNLDFCIGCSGVATMTSDNTDLNEYDANGDGTGAMFTDYAYDSVNDRITWVPTLANANATVTGTPAYLTTTGGTTVSGWANDSDKPYMMEPGDLYSYEDTRYNSLALCEAGNHAESQCNHYHVGNYYNWPATVAMSNASSFSADYTVAPNSICPAGWRLPNGLTEPDSTVIQSDFNKLLSDYNLANDTDTTGRVDVGWKDGVTSFNAMKLAPLYFARSGFVLGSSLDYFGTYGNYWSSTVYDGSNAYYLGYFSSELYPAYWNYRYYGRSVRCMVR